MSNSKQPSLQLVAIFILLFLCFVHPALAHNKSSTDGKKKHKSSSSSSSGGSGSGSGQIEVKVSVKGSFSQVMAFGDSYTDTGNCMFLNGLKKFFGGFVSHSPYGSIFKSPLSGNRFCNGRLVIDFLCEALGLPPLPPYKDPQVNVTFGVNFAVSGSTSLTSDLFSKYKIGQGLLWKSMVPQNFMTQLDWFDEFLERMAASGQGSKSSSSSGTGSQRGSGQIGASGSSSGSGQIGGSGQAGGSASGSGQIGGSSGGQASGGASGSGQIGGSGSGQAGGSATSGGQIGGSGSGQAGGSATGGGQIGGSGSGQAGGSATGGGQIGGSGKGQAGGSAAGSGQISGSGQASGSAGIDLDDVLFWIGEMGVNDYARIISTTGLHGNWLAQMSVNHFSKVLKALLDRGAKYIVVQGMPPIGCLPLALSFAPDSDRDKHGCSESINSLVKFHNELLQKRIAEFQGEHKDCIISYADYFSAYVTIMTNVTVYQVQEPLKACCGAGTGPFNFSPKFMCGAGSTSKCSDPSKYIVWDGLHLTEAMHSHLADLFFNKGYCHPSVHDMVAHKQLAY
uniref:Uncharacterized protein n=1 Tax=Kalanchoe fedtschenkoi TaxID=63787 RepID=A0A7N1A9D5_KALFE